MDITVKDVKKYLNRLAEHLQNEGLRTQDLPGKALSTEYYYNCFSVFDIVRKIENYEKLGYIKKFEEDA